ncbi:MAG: glycosyltransferase family 4 protein [Melioribacteraceae bacterium]|nr:glycosyltransferase family 4 protein [Melioribacteraceae bacterium]
MQNKKKILHIILRSSYDGASVLPVRVIRHLPEYDHKIVSIFKGALFEETEEEINYDHLIESSEIDKYSKTKILSFLIFLLKNKFDIIHYHCGGVSLLFLSLLFRKNAKIIHHIHSGVISGDNNAKDISVFHKLLYKILDKKTIKIACAEHVYDFYRKNINSGDEIFLVKNAVEKINELNKKQVYGIGYLGRITKEKGINIVFDLINNKKKLPSRLNYYLKGDVNLAVAEFDRFRNSYNNYYSEPSLDVDDFFSKVDILLFPSIASEALPLVVLEAVSHNVAVVLVKDKWSVEIFGESYPFYINETNKVNSIIEMINKYYQSRELRDGIISLYRQINDKYNFQKMIESLIKIYNENSASK